MYLSFKKKKKVNYSSFVLKKWFFKLHTFFCYVLYSLTFFFWHFSLCEKGKGGKGAFFQSYDYFRLCPISMYILSVYCSYKIYLCNLQTVGGANPQQSQHYSPGKGSECARGAGHEQPSEPESLLGSWCTQSSYTPFKGKLFIVSLLSSFIITSVAQCFSVQKLLADFQF